MEEFVLGTEFYGNPDFGDAGMSKLLPVLTFPLYEDVSNPESGNTYKFWNIQVLKLCHCRLSHVGARTLGGYIVHQSALPLRVLSLDGNPIRHEGASFLMKSFVGKLKAMNKDYVVDDDPNAGLSPLEIENMLETEEDKGRQTLSMLDLDLDPETLRHACTRQQFGKEPVLEELSMNDCFLEDITVKWLLIFAQTRRILLLKVGGAYNDLSGKMRAEIKDMNLELTQINDMERGYITAVAPIHY